MKNIIENRTRTFDWADPMIGAKSAMKMSGYDYLKSIADGDLPMPPIMSLMGVDNCDVDKGYMRFEFNAEEYHYNTIGGVHGGVFSTLLDSCISCAVHTTLPQGVGFSTIDLKVNFIRPITIETGLVICEGNAIHTGRKTAVGEGRLLDASGKLLATASVTCLILS
ncbi:PaaI family thioesterase [Moritella viscosa]|uniref:PaaI family thioesterase n=1 Tax=Moritella viscosa TaxID=80854 RepID=UPI000916ABFA|nr:PaaI family thioesterase [Moritella viscosa]SGY93720.1 Phenylacetic acid degradation-related protein [Moritella viscosa]SGY94014.1 Phenylacetic acid degradation-related protein [Moritella viscosa]